MTKVEIQSGVCGFVTKVSADSEDGQTVRLTIESGCAGVRALAQAMPDQLDAFELCFKKPGGGILYELAAQHLPSHAGCIVIAGILKCIEAECELALRRDCSITFVD
jgi:hypothetical protein